MIYNGRYCFFEDAIVDVLRVENLSLSALDAGGDSILILNSVCLRIPDGGVTCLVGESGAGKTMLARAIVALLPRGVNMISGRFFFRERALAFEALKNLRGRAIFYIPQDAQSSLNPVLRVKRQFSDFGSFPRPVLCETLDRFGFKHPERVLHSYAHQLSGGEAQRCLLAMAALRKPELLILDEPFRSLDMDLQLRAADLVQSLRRDFGITVLLISHNLPMVERIGDFMAVMFRGKIVETGVLGQMTASPNHPYTREIVGYFEDNS